MIKYKFLDNFRADLQKKTKNHWILLEFHGFWRQIYSFFLQIENINFHAKFANF